MFLSKFAFLKFEYYHRCHPKWPLSATASANVIIVKRWLLLGMCYRSRHLSLINAISDQLQTAGTTTSTTISNLRCRTLPQFGPICISTFICEAKNP
jgi:hypothetical protein